jgi:hypothetical protein
MGLDKQGVSKIDTCSSCRYDWSEAQKRRLLEVTGTNLGRHKEAE